MACQQVGLGALKDSGRIKSSHVWKRGRIKPPFKHIFVCVTPQDMLFVCNNIMFTITYIHLWGDSLTCAKTYTAGRLAQNGRLTFCLCHIFGMQSTTYLILCFGVNKLWNVNVEFERKCLPLRSKSIKNNESTQVVKL